MEGVNKDVALAALDKKKITFIMYLAALGLKLKFFFWGKFQNRAQVFLIFQIRTKEFSEFKSGLTFSITFQIKTSGDNMSFSVTFLSIFFKISECS